MPEPIAPEPGTQDLAEKVARAKWARTPGALPWDSISPGRQEVHTRIAAEWLDAIRAAELAVVELPATVLREERINGIGLEVEAPTPDGRRQEVTGLHFPGHDDDRIGLGQVGWRSPADARFDAARILAACDAVERLRAEHQDGESR